MAAALEHAVSAHGYRGSEEFRLVLRAAAKGVNDHSLYQRVWNRRIISGELRSEDIMIL